MPGLLLPIYNNLQWVEEKADGKKCFLAVIFQSFILFFFKEIFLIDLGEKPYTFCLLTKYSIPDELNVTF